MNLSMAGAKKYPMMVSVAPNRRASTMEVWTAWLTLSSLRAP